MRTRRRAEASNPWAQLATAVAAPAVEAALAPVVTEIQSPMAPDPSTILNTLVWNDLLGGRNVPITRATAMAIPAMARARNLLCGTIGRLPLSAWRRDVRLEAAGEPAWFYRTDAGLPPYHRMVWTVDDLLFYGWSLWARSNSAASDNGGRPLSMVRVAQERWRFTPAATIETRRADGTWAVAARDEVCLIPGPHEGILAFGQTPIREAADLAKAASDAAANPSAYINLHYTGDEPMAAEDIDALVARWAAARRGENGGVAFTNKWVEAREMGTHEAHLLTEGRNAAAVDMARLASVPAALVDATNAGASLTYETTEGRNAEFIDYGLSLYMDAVTGRLSMDDIVAAGVSVRFDTASLRDPAPTPTGPTTED